MNVYQTLFSVADSETEEAVETSGRQKEIKWKVGVDNVAQSVYQSGNNLRFQMVNPRRPEQVWAKCIFSDGKVTKESKAFLIVVEGVAGRCRTLPI